LKIINEIDISNKTVLIRFDYNVPILKGKILDAHRIISSLDTIHYCLKNHTAIVIMSHLGRPNGYNNKELSLKPVCEKLKSILKRDIIFSENCISSKAIEISKNLKSGQIHFLENLRFYKEEINNDDKFSNKLSQHANIYINDAFATTHRKHSSNYGLLKYFKTYCIGFLINKEITHLETIKKTPQKPNIMILGGAKITDKIAFINNMLNNIDILIIGGAMGFNFLKAKKKYKGASIADFKTIKIARDIIKNIDRNNVSLILPVDALHAKSLDEYILPKISSVEDIGKLDYAYDIGPKTILLFKEVMKNAKTIFWNGPLGVYEYKKYSKGTKSIASAISRYTESGCVSIIGGGDTASAVKNLNEDCYFTHISTGGGASLHFLSNDQLPTLI
tara:strand:+ start:84 stop:1256 length:1173 start_codon:yes stop_codon:yes gene_type:complete